MSLAEELKRLLIEYDAAGAEEDVALEALMQPAVNAPKNERGQFLDPEAVDKATEPFRPRHRAAQDRRLELQREIEDLAFESARLAVELADRLQAPSA